MNIVAIILFVTAWMVFLFLAIRAILIRRNSSIECANIPVVVAGSGQAPRFARIVDPSFFDGEKEDDISKRNIYYVAGNSMALCGIKEKDIVSVDSTKKDFNVPTILLLRKACADIDSAEFKLRRTWAICDNAEWDTLEKALNNILANNKFQSIREANEYSSDETILEDFRNVRYKRFKEQFAVDQKVIISTTLHNGRQEKNEPYFNKIMFSIHPFSTIIGKVESVYRS